ncbi:MAG: caspase family protein [Saprospiraceae bacterium]|nr:caspase family protein [Saprospiraceae bacterium]
MKKVLLLQIALNYVNPKNYSGWEGKLEGCLHDASKMFDMLISLQKIEIVDFCELTNEQATVANFTDLLKRFLTLTSAEKLIITYSGHGGQVKDRNKDETDGLDETFCLYDGQVIDDDIYKMINAYGSINKEVILFVDSCHSGTISRAERLGFLTLTQVDKDLNKKICPRDISLLSRSHSIFKKSRISQKDNKIPLICFSACQEYQYSYDTPNGGLFTKALCEVIKPELKYEPLLLKVIPKIIKLQKPRITYRNTIINKQIFS